jgi:hypothetical protein
MVLNVVLSIQAATGRAMVRDARITPRRVSSSPQRRKATARAQLLVRGQGQAKQGLKASVDPREPEM